MEHIHQRNTLKAKERLKLRSQIEMLFQQGEAFSVYPVRVVYQFVKSDKNVSNNSVVKAGFSVPKKRFKRAVQRNRLRRLLKESWRLQKHVLADTMPEGLQLHCFLIYISSETSTFEQAKAATASILTKLAAKVQNSKAQ